MNMLFPVVILAGGLATRLRPMTETIPKSLLIINNEPFIAHQLRLLHKQGVRDVVLCVGYLGELIEAYVGDGSTFGLHVQYSQDGAALRGTGGAIKQALPLLPEAFFILYGDSYLDCDYQAVQETFQSAHKLGLMTVFHNEGKWDTSNIEYSNHQILAYDKTNRTNQMRHIDYGLGILTQRAFKSADLHHATFDLATLYQTLLKNDQLAAYEVTKRFYEAGSIAGIKELEYYLSGV